MGIITLITDFGRQDEYVGLMKGVMLGIDPAARIIDLTHAIDPQDVAQAAFTVEVFLALFSGRDHPRRDRRPGGGH